MTVESGSDLPFVTLTDAELYARLDLTAAQQQQVAGKRGPTAKRIQSLLDGIASQLKARLIERGLPLSVPDADYIAAKVAEFDRDFPIPKIDAESPSVRSVSSGEVTVAEAGGGVGAVGNLEPTFMIGTGCAAGYAEPSRVHADRHSSDGGDGK